MVQRRRRAAVDRHPGLARERQAVRPLPAPQRFCSKHSRSPRGAYRRSHCTRTWRHAVRPTGRWRPRTESCPRTGLRPRDPGLGIPRACIQDGRRNAICCGTLHLMRRGWAAAVTQRPPRAGRDRIGPRQADADGSKPMPWSALGRSGGGGMVSAPPADSRAAGAGASPTGAGTMDARGHRHRHRRR
jgi:hypothetical protein